MNLYRISKQKYLEDYSGRGSSFKNGARWNPPNFQVMYFALSSSVALLEMANYFSNPRLIPKSYRLGIYECPDDCFIKLERSKLPTNWSDYPHPKSTQKMGKEFLDNARYLGMIVPSAATPLGLEPAVIINPLHKDIGKIKLIDVTQELYNDRTFAGLS